MRQIFRIISSILFCVVAATSVYAQSPTPEAGSDRYKDLENQIQELQNKLSETQNKAKTLSSQISYMDTQIKRTTLQISVTEQKIEDLNVEIASLSARIDKLETSLTQVANVLINRVIATYKQSNTSSVELLFGSDNFSDFLLRFKYIKTVQETDKLLMHQMQQAKDTFTTQKKAKDEKKQQQEALRVQLKKQKDELDGQKAAKAQLLSVTKNDEKRYQELLSQARAELEAIQAIIAGKGDESEVGHINEGDKIASIIQGSSCNSGGAHLHFIVSNGGNVQNPFNYLKSGVDFENCSGSSCGSSDGDPFNPSGSWNWPINPKISYNQGYGSTWAVRNSWVGRIYNFHNGIDIDSDSPEVRAVRNGKLFRGSYSGSSGCRLRYVRVAHDDSNLETFYLHINY